MTPQTPTPDDGARERPARSDAAAERADASRKGQPGPTPTDKPNDTPSEHPTGEDGPAPRGDTAGSGSGGGSSLGSGGGARPDDAAGEFNRSAQREGFHGG